MSDAHEERGLVSLSTRHPVWNRFFQVAPLVIVGTREADGRYDLAPKHMAMPMGWANYFGFVCTPRHRTYVNARREEGFTVSFPRPGQVLVASLASAPRCENDEKPSLDVLETFPGSRVDAPLVEAAYLYLECALHRVYDDFGDNSLVTGKVIGAHVAEAAIRRADRDDRDLLAASPLLAYLSPGRYAEIARSRAFPFHRGWSR